MKNLSMILRVLAIVAAVAAAAFFFLAKGKLGEKQTQLSQTQQSLESTKAELATAQNDISDLEARLKSERDALAASKRQVENIRSEMYTARQEVSRTQRQLGEARTKISELEETASQLRSDLVEAEQMTAVASSNEQELATLQARVEELETLEAELESSLEEARSKAASAQTATSSGQNQPMSLPSAGRLQRTFSPKLGAPALPQSASLGMETTIETVSADDGLIIIRSRPELELAPGQTIRLIQDLKSLGSVQITSVRDSLAIANILPGAEARSLESGSKVRLMR